MNLFTRSSLNDFSQQNYCQQHFTQLTHQLMAQQMKANVLIHTQTNRSFIQEKVYDEFKYECLKDDELKDMDVDKMVRVIKQIYDFGENNQHMQEFFKRIPDNVHKYIAGQYKVTSETVDLVIDIGKLLDTIFYCIEHGFTEQTHKKSKQEKIKEAVVQNPEKKQPCKIVKEEVEEQAAEKVRKFYVPKPKTPQKKNFIQKFQMPEKKMPARYLMHLAKQTKKPEQEPVVELNIQPIDSSYIERNKQLIDQRLEDLYKHYCAQQQNLGQHATFDRIKHQCSQMTLGKFLLFCKVSKLFDDKDMTKEILTSKFRKISQGFKEINYEKFKELLAAVDSQYIALKQKANGQNYVAVTYQARLLLQGREYKKLKRDVDLPFCTKQKQGREVKKFTTIDDSRYVKRDELTSHSGKFGRDLKQQIQRKLVSQSMSAKPKNKQSDGSNTQRSKIVRLDNIKFNNMPGMEWVLQQDDSDKTFMKEYRMRDVVGDIKKRVNDLQKMQKSNKFN